MRGTHGFVSKKFGDSDFVMELVHYAAVCVRVLCVAFHLFTQPVCASAGRRIVVTLIELLGCRE